MKFILGNVAFVGLVLAIVWIVRTYSTSPPAKAANTNSLTPTNAKPAASSQKSGANEPLLTAAPEIPTMEINHAVMVTVELDFGPTIPSIAEALMYIERRYQPDDGKGRTFAILDAYGEPTADKKKLHMSMHVSTEKPGLGSLVFGKTKEVLWQTKIVATTNAANFSGKNLTIYMDAGTKDGKSWLLDGSGGPPNILEAKVKDLNQPVREVWPDGEEREFTFIYSACGCPVKVMVRRTGVRTVRTKELPVMFPDDPAAMSVITKLMGW